MLKYTADVSPVLDAVLCFDAVRENGEFVSYYEVLMAFFQISVY